MLGGAWKASETVCISGIIIIFRAVSPHCRNREKTKEKFVFKAALLVVVMLELIYQGWAEYAPQAGGYVEEFATQGEALSMLTKDAAGNLVKNHAKDTTYRYESLQSEEWKTRQCSLELMVLPIISVLQTRISTSFSGKCISTRQEISVIPVLMPVQC